MKINLFLTFLAIAMAALLGYLAYVVAGENPNNAVYGIGSSLCFAATLLPIIGANYRSSRIATNARVLASIFFIAFLISNAVFVNISVSLSYYIIMNGLLIIGYLATLYNITNIKNI